MPVGKLHAWRSARCLAPGFLGSGRERFALCSQATTSDPATQFREAGDFYTRITCRLSWNGDGSGSSLWALLFFGGIAVGILSYNRYATRDWMPRRRVMQPLVILALAGVAMHALVDFPFQIESIQLYVATYLGVCWGSSLWYDKSEVRRHRSETVVRTERC